MRKEILRIDKLSKAFGDLRALNNVSLSVEEGERRGIVGPNGSGKTTLFNVICGILSPSNGSVHFFGQDITRLRVSERANLGMGRTFQINSLFPKLTVLQTILLATGRKGVGRETFQLNKAEHLVKAEQLARDFGLWEKRNVLVTEIAYGEQRILELILAFSLEPRLLLLDEPAAGLTQAEVDMVITTIREVSKDATVVVIEHDMDVLFKIAEQVTVLHHGEVLSDGSKESVRADPKVREVYLRGA